MSDTRNRLKILRIHADLLIHFFLMDGKRPIRADGMPEDAKIVAMDVSQHFDSNMLQLQIHSETFCEVKEGHALPEIVVTYTAEKPMVREVIMEETVASGEPS